MGIPMCPWVPWESRANGNIWAGFMGMGMNPWESKRMELLNFITFFSLLCMLYFASILCLINNNLDTKLA